MIAASRLATTSASRTRHQDAAEPESTWPSAVQTVNRQTAGVRASHISLLSAGVLTIVGSVSAWVSVSVLGRTISVGGTDQSISNALTINGWITAALGILIVLLGALQMVSNERSLRVLALVIAGLALGFSTYYVIRVVQELSKAHAAAAQFSALGRSLPVSEHIGWGLVLLLTAAVASVISSGFALRDS